MRSISASAGRPAAVAVVALALAAATTTAVTTPASAAREARAAHAKVVKVHRGGPDATVRFHRSRPGEAFLDATVSARGISWASRKNDSAVVSAYVDGRYVTDIVITSSGPVRRQFALGHLRTGRHTLRLHYATKRSRSTAGVATLRALRVTTVSRTSRAYVAARFAPVLYGRNIPELGGRFENNRTDTPLVAWHQVLPIGHRGHSLIEYSVMWSNEDGGTSPPMLMAQWGRTTDIEWVYRVEVNRHGHRVPGTGVFQAPAHQTARFHGRYDGTHPVLQTCTSNNNVCDSSTLHRLKQTHDPMRFALSTRDRLPLDQPREHEMDIHPWTYQVMAREMVREHKLEKHPNPTTSSVGDQRTYLYVAVTHSTLPASAAAVTGLAVEVRLKGDPTTYTSNHGIPVWTINRDGPAATTVELPVGTTRADVASISVRRVPIGTDTGASLTVTRLGRAFFLNRRYLPKSSFAHWQGSKTLTGGTPTAVIWAAS